MAAGKLTCSGFVLCKTSGALQTAITALTISSTLSGSLIILPTANLEDNWYVAKVEMA